jgi:adenylate cyclase class 2
MHIEVEQKFAVDDMAGIEERLRKLGVKETRTVAQVDQYFNHPSRDFAETDEALRVRRIGEANFVTYKGPKLDAATKTRRELELPLSPGASAATDFGQLLVALGFRPVSEVHKKRRIQTVIWEGQEVEVALDEVAELGSFIELEVSADEEQVEAAKSSIKSLASELGLKRNERRSYLELLLAKRT